MSHFITKTVKASGTSEIEAEFQTIDDLKSEHFEPALTSEIRTIRKPNQQKLGFRRPPNFERSDFGALL